MKKVFKIYKCLLINGMIFSLISHPMMNLANAQEAPVNKGFGAQDISSIANGVLSIYAGYLGQKQQFMQQQIAMANNQKLMAQFSPSCRKPDGTACYTTAGKMFPECVLPASISSMPQNVCGNATPEPNQISTMITYEAIATGWMNYYDIMSNKASNASYPTGLSCLESKKKALDSQLIEMANSLSRLQDVLNRDKQAFKANQQRVLDSITESNDEIFGMGEGNKKDLNKTRDFAKYFSQSCQSVIGRETLKNGQNLGLNGILQGLSTVNKSASDFRLNKATIEADVRRETQKIAATIASGGVEDFLAQGYVPSSDENAKNFAAIKTQIEKQNKEFVIAKTRINKVLAEVGYTPPPMDKQFSVDLEEFANGASDFFKKKFVNDCVTGASSGIAIPVSDILGALEQKRTHSQGTARNDYRAALQTILNSTAMISDKMDQIKALEADYPGMTVTYKDSTQSRITETPYNLFMLTISKCEERYGQGDQFSNKGSAGVSYQKKVERAKAALQELKNLNDGLSTKITNSILSQVLTCNESTMKSGSCSEDSLNTSKEGFCISHAEQCSNEILGCYAEANNHITTRKTKIKNQAAIFNNNVAAMIARSNALYEQQKAAITSITKMIQSKFPGTNFNIPADMFVTMPDLKKDAFGIELAGNGDMSSFLDGPNSMPEKINKLKEMFATQQEKVDAEITEYIAGQENAMKTQKSRWEKLFNDCKSAIDTSSKALAQQNQEMAAKQNEEDQDVGTFCKKYNSISKNPLGACGKVSELASLSEKVAKRLSSQATTLTEDFANACDAFNNENDSIKEVDCSSDYENEADRRLCRKRESAKIDKNTPSKLGRSVRLSSICKEEKEGTFTSDKQLIALAADFFPKEDRDKIRNLKNFEEVDKILRRDNIDDGGFFGSLEDFVASGDKKKSICENIQNKIKSGQSSSSTSVPEPKLEEPVLDPKATPEAREAALKKQIEDLKLKQASDSAKKLGTNEAETELKEKILPLLGELKLTQAPDSKSSIKSQIQKIGEQMEGPCDMQSNAGLTKDTGFDLQKFDQSYLGAAKTR
jgi:hypothetical protein